MTTLTVLRNSLLTFWLQIPTRHKRRKEPLLELVAAIGCVGQHGFTGRLDGCGAFGGGGGEQRGCILGGVLLRIVLFVCLYLLRREQLIAKPEHVVAMFSKCVCDFVHSHVSHDITLRSWFPAERADLFII